MPTELPQSRICFTPIFLFHSFLLTIKNGSHPVIFHGLSGQPRNFEIFSISFPVIGINRFNLSSWVFHFTDLL